MGFTFTSHSRGCGGFVGLLFFTLFWCGITGVFVGMLVNSVYRSLDAQRRYAETQGTVLASDVSSHSDSDGSTHGFTIRYRYAVGGQPYESGRYAFGEMNSSDGYSRARALAASHPSGATVRVYYDPQRPAEAVIDRSFNPIMAFLFLFLQPFILIGLAMLAACVSYPFTRAAFNRFINAADTPAAIPSWGRILRVPNGYLVLPRTGAAGVIGAAAVGYGLTCFVSIFVVGFLFGGFSSPNLTVVGGALLVAVGVGAGAAVWSRRSAGRKVRLLIDQMYRKVVLVRPQQAEEIAFRDIAGWIVTRMENPRRMKQEGAPTQVPVLSIRKTTNEDVHVHIFEATEDAPLIAAKAAEVLAHLTDNRPVLATLEPEDDAIQPTVAGVLEAIKKAAAKAKAMKDLT